MCGIFGYVGQIAPEYYGIVHTLLENLAWFSEERGTHATGFAAVMMDGSVVADKMPVKGSIFCNSSAKFRAIKEEAPVSFIAHTRYGTGSNPLVNNNNHPFFGENFHMVHNGTINAWESFAKEHGILDEMTSETDSEIILRILEKRRKTKGDTEAFKHSVQWLLDNIWGNMAVALLDLNERAVWLFRNDNPIVVFEFPEGVFGPTKVVFFASTSKIFNSAWEASYHAELKEWNVSANHLVDNQLYKLCAFGELSNENVMKSILMYRINVTKRFYRQLTTWSDGYRYGYGYTTPTSSTIQLEGRRKTAVVDSDFVVREVAKKEYYSVAQNPTLRELVLSTEDKKEIRKLRDQSKSVSNEARIDGIPLSNYMRFNSACLKLVMFDESIAAEA